MLFLLFGSFICDSIALDVCYPQAIFILFNDILFDLIHSQLYKLLSKAIILYWTNIHHFYICWPLLYSTFEPATVNLGGHFFLFLNIIRFVTLPICNLLLCDQCCVSIRAFLLFCLSTNSQEEIETLIKCVIWAWSC